MTRTVGATAPRPIFPKSRSATTDSSRGGSHPSPRGSPDRRRVACHDSRTSGAPAAISTATGCLVTQRPPPRHRAPTARRRGAPPPPPPPPPPPAPPGGGRG